MGFQLREARLEDASQLARVHIDTWRTAYRGLIAEERLEAMRYDKGEEGWRKRIGEAKEGRYVLVPSVTGRRIVGFLSGGPGADSAAEECELNALYILEDYQGQGIGRALFDHAECHFRDEGYRVMLCWVLRDNWKAREFYEAMGGTVAGEKQLDIGGTAYPVVSYRWDLAGGPS